MAIRLSGMTSGLDTDSIVKAMVSSYTTRKEKYQKAQTKLEWTQDAWKSLNTKVYSLYSNISNLRFSTAYNLKKTSVSDTTKATVKAGSGAPSGTQSLKIKQMAKAQATRLEVDASGGYRLNDQAVSADELLKLLQQSNLKDATLAIAADKNVPYDYVARAISAARQAGIEKVGLFNAKMQ